eukprot:ANDGO_05348.mRNA.1 hypothetical protein
MSSRVPAAGKAVTLTSLTHVGAGAPTGSNTSIEYVLKRKSIPVSWSYLHAFLNARVSKRKLQYARKSLTSEDCDVLGTACAFNSALFLKSTEQVESNKGSPTAAITARELLQWCSGSRS